MKNLVLFLLLSLTTIAIGGNSDKEKEAKRVIAGRVADAYGESLPGVTIRIAETGETFFSDLEGNFKLSLKTDQIYTLSVHTIGHAPVELKSSGLTSFSEISLNPL
jgi:hypothetical protein